MRRSADLRPRARPRSELIVEALGDELLVYDNVQHRAHSLSAQAAAVWTHCDGVHSVEALRELAGGAAPLEVVLAELEASGLLLSERPTRVVRSRRAMLKQTAVAAAVVASPVVFSIVAPSVAQAASVCGGQNQACCGNNKCNSPQFDCQGGLCLPIKK